MRHLLLTAVLTLATSHAFANFSGLNLSGASFTGEWSGVGNLIGGTEPATCKEVQLKIQQTEKTFTIESGTFRCPSYTELWQPQTMEINGQDLIIDHQKVGTILGNQIFFSVHDEYTTEQYKLEITEQGIYFEKNLFTKESSSLYLTLTSLLKAK